MNLLFASLLLIAAPALGVAALPFIRAYLESLMP